jgi:hypothetical protein
MQASREYDLEFDWNSGRCQSTYAFWHDAEWVGHCGGPSLCLFSIMRRAFLRY